MHRHGRRVRHRQGPRQGVRGRRRTRCRRRYLRRSRRSTTGIRTLIDLAHIEFGPVDIYVANAGVLGPPGLGVGEGDWDPAIAVNLSAHVRAAALLVPGWIRGGRGYFVSIASAAGLLTHIGGAAYAATVSLEPDPETVSGYRWAEGQGPPIRLSSGTLTRAEITTRRQRPLDLVVPLIRRLTGIDG